MNLTVIHSGTVLRHDLQVVVALLMMASCTESLDQKDQPDSVDAALDTRVRDENNQAGFNQSHRDAELADTLFSDAQQTDSTGGVVSQHDAARSTSRSFYLAAAPMQYEFKTDDIDTVFDMQGFESKVDLVSVHQDFFGIPWNEFATDLPLPEVWVQTMKTIKADIDAMGLAVYLSITPLNGVRDSVMPNAVQREGRLEIDNDWMTGCIDFTQDTRLDFLRAYKEYTRFMVDLFQPIFLTNAIEMNIYDNNCPAQYESLIALANAIYDQEKALNPEVVIFPSFAVKMMWGYDTTDGCEIGDRTCLTAALDRNLAVKRDRFGISSYPLFMQREWEAIPEDFFTAINEITGERVVFAETGWGNRDVILRYPTRDSDCMTLLQSSDEDQVRYMRYLFEKAELMDSDLITWWSLRDFLPEHITATCPCASTDLWCLLYDAVDETGLLGAWLMWGTMGILDFQYQPKPSHELWMSYKERPLELE